MATKAKLHTPQPEITEALEGPQHPTVVQELVQIVPTWRTVSGASEWAEARETAKKLSEENRDKTFRIYCAPHTYGGIDHWGKPYVGKYEGGEQQYRNGFRYDADTEEGT
jgi:hypothetical protein